MDRGWGLALVVIGLGIALVGLLAWTGALSWFGRLPGDLRFGSDNVRVYAPITSMLLVSAAVTLLVWLVRR